MIGVVRDGDAAHFGDARVGVIQSADQIIDGIAAGIEQQQHRTAVGRVHPDPLLPVQGGSIKIGELRAVQFEAADFSPWKVEQADAECGTAFNLMGFARGCRAHDATTKASEPVSGAQSLLQQRQQAREIACEVTRDEHQCQIRFSRAQNTGHFPRSLLKRSLAGEGVSASGLRPAAPEPVERIERNHELDPTNPVVLLDDRDNGPLMCLVGV